MSIHSTIPTSSTDRRKFYIAIGIIAACVIWLGVYLVGNATFRPVARAPDSPGWRAVTEMNAKLNEDHAFADVGLSVATEKPLKLTVNGAVYTQKDLDRLPGVLKELNGGAEFDMHVDLQRR